MMLRPSVLCASALLFFTSCVPAFKDRRTPSGEFCSDMPVIPADEEPNLEYHRLQPVQSDIKAHTEAERLESLRKAACLEGGDAVIEAVNEEVRNDQAQFVLVSSGTAVIWSRPRGSEVVPLVTHKKKTDGSATPTTTGEPTATVPPATAPTATAPPPVTAQPTATPVPTATATAVPTAAPTAVPTAKPSGTPVKSKLPTNAAPKPITPTKKK